jgi:hypothetical protein
MRHFTCRSNRYALRVQLILIRDDILHDGIFVGFGFVSFTIGAPEKHPKIVQNDVHGDITDWFAPGAATTLTPYR